jgi:hypothetical protein
MLDKNASLPQGQRLKILRHLCEANVIEFARLTGISRRAIETLEADKGARISAQQAEAIVNTVKNHGVITTSGWLLHGAAPAPLKVAIDGHPLIQKIAQANIAAMQKEQEIFLSSSASAVILQITDDAMLPLYEIGTIVGGKYLPKKDTARAVGQECIVQLADTILCRRLLLLGEKSNSFTLACLNPKPSSTITNLDNVKSQSLKVAPITRIWRCWN